MRSPGAQALLPIVPRKKTRRAFLLFFFSSAKTGAALPLSPLSKLGLKQRENFRRP